MLKPCTPSPELMKARRANRGGGGRRSEEEESCGWEFHDTGEHMISYEEAMDRETEYRRELEMITKAAKPPREEAASSSAAPRRPISLRGNVDLSPTMQRKQTLHPPSQTSSGIAEAEIDHMTKQPPPPQPRRSPPSPRPLRLVKDEEPRRPCHSWPAPPTSAAPQPPLRRQLFPTPEHENPPPRSEDGAAINVLWCEVCQVPCMDAYNLKEHLRGKKHRSRVEAMSFRGVGVGAGGGLFRCELCEIWCMNEYSLAQHRAGRSHAGRSMALQAPRRINPSN